ncbi:hypothetical protein CYMTET_29449 [Cymbomonas tetramitiformis]|uniref:Uncharacterized protein n=1 Tax=Cymbomonas tetramitiformis TaxID=36881 RepID=A0AAE0FL12_9CHLO|nr:hypothetical protein CYMTET_29449 [Cymbomonas tetramitiformis]
MEKEIEKRGDVTKLSRAQVKDASAINWGLELVMTVPHEVRRLAKEVDFKGLRNIWDPWAGTGVIAKVMKKEWSHLSFMNNDTLEPSAGLDRSSERFAARQLSCLEEEVWSV